MQHASNNSPGKLRVRFRLGTITMPMGNPLPMVLPETARPAMASSSCEASSPAATGTAITYTGDPIQVLGAEPNTFGSGNHQHQQQQQQGKVAVVVDAHNVSGINIEQAIEGISQALPIALAPEELCLRRQIADKLLFTMGNCMTHYEADIDPVTGTALVDFEFQPNIVSAETDEHLEHIHAYDPHNPDMKVADVGIGRLFCTQVDPETGRKFPFMISSQPLDLVNIMERSIEVTEAAMHCSKESTTTGDAIALAEKYPSMHPSSILAAREYDFPMRHNFCNTFALGTVLPFVGEVVPAASVDEAIRLSQKKHAMEVHKGLYIAHSLTQVGACVRVCW